MWSSSTPRPPRFYGIIDIKQAAFIVGVIAVVFLVGDIICTVEATSKIWSNQTTDIYEFYDDHPAAIFLPLLKWIPDVIAVVCLFIGLKSECCQFLTIFVVETMIVALLEIVRICVNVIMLAASPTYFDEPRLLSLDLVYAKNVLWGQDEKVPFSTVSAVFLPFAVVGVALNISMAYVVYSCRNYFKKRYSNMKLPAV